MVNMLEQEVRELREQQMGIWVAKPLGNLLSLVHLACSVNWYVMGAGS